MKTFFTFQRTGICLLLAMLLSVCHIQAQNNLAALLPLPNHIQQGEGLFRLSENEKMVISSGTLSFIANELQNIWHQRFDMELPIGTEGRIKLLLNSEVPDYEQYRLSITPNEITIEGKTAAGILYGIYTLDQVLLGDVINTGNKKIQSLFIEDSPAYAHRALMLDPGRLHTTF